LGEINMRLKLAGIIIVAALFFSPAVKADTFTFNFNTASSGPSLSAGDSSATISTYMGQVLSASGCAGCTVAVTGAVVDHTYNGEGRVVGPGSGSTYNSLTLATSEHAANSNGTYTVNANDNFIATQMNMVFSGITLNGTVSFDFEIFPDGSGVQPDFILQYVQGGTVSGGVVTGGTLVALGTNLGLTPTGGAGNACGSLTHSPLSGSGTETSQQCIGTWTVNVTNATELEFVDWPQTIGVDNLVINRTTTPEPESLVLFGSGLLGVAALIRRRLSA
jgi:hypothetical protein